MLYIFNGLVSLLCIITIIACQCFPQLVINSYFKNHTSLFLIKLLFISMFIYLFIYNFSISNYKVFIVSGCINFTFFHILEGLLNHKILIKNEIKN